VDLSDRYSYGYSYQSQLQLLELKELKGRNALHRNHRIDPYRSILIIAHTSTYGNNQ